MAAHVFALCNQEPKSMKLPRSRFTILTTGTMLLVTAITASATASASTCVWTGATDGLWSNAGNWTACAGSAPLNGDTLQFPEAAANKINSNDIATLTSVAGLAFTGSTSGYALNGNALALGAAGLANSNASGLNTVDMNLSLSAAQTFAGSNAAIVLNGTLDLGGQDLAIDWPSTILSAVPWTVNGAIGGSGAIAVVGSGGGTYALVLAGTNTFAGSVSLMGGYTRLNNGSALGVADGTPANGTSIASGAAIILGGINVGNESLTVAAGLGESGNGVLEAFGSNDWAGPVQLTGPGLSKMSATANSMLNFSGVVSGSGGLLLGYGPTSTFRFGNSGNTYSGGITNISSGARIQLGDDNVIPSSNTIVLQGDSIFDLNGFDDSIASLSCTATDSVIIPDGSALTVGGNNADTTCAGVISGGSTTVPFTVLTKTGTGTLTLTGDSTYPGEVDALGGGLEVNGIFANEATSTIFVGSAQNASLFGNGTVGAVVTAGTIHGGTSSTPGTLTTGFLSFNGVGKQSARIASAASYDRINAANVNMASGPALNIALSYVPVSGTVFTLIDNAGGAAIQGTYNGLAEGATLLVNGITFSISYVGGDGNDITLTSISNGLPPSVTYLPATGSQVALSASGTGSIDAIATDFTAGTSVSINACAVSPASPAFSASAFTVTNPSFAAPNGSIDITCSPQPASVNGTLSCNEIFNGSAGPTLRSWPISCPAAAGGTPPTAALGSSSVGLINGLGSIDVDVLTSGSALASLGLDCSIPAGSANFQITSGASRLIDAPAVVGVDAPTIGLSCTEQTTTQTALLSCLQSPSSGPVPAPLTATVTCRGNSAPPPIPDAVPLPTLSRFGSGLLMLLIVALGARFARFPRTRQ
jgi:fibronectin-binding autotransporter adhesin